MSFLKERTLIMIDINLLKHKNNILAENNKRQDTDDYL